MIFWVLYLILFFVTVMLLFRWALSWFHKMFFNNKNK